MVVRSTAVGDDNVEIKAAKAARIPIVQRAEMLAELMRFHHGIAISGTHGKTTTTSLTACILAENGFDPTFVIGGRLNSVGCNARLGKSQYFIAEADESDASFLKLNPIVSVVTNIDEDHMQTYQDDRSQLFDAFHGFLHRLPFYGLAVLCIDDVGVRRLIGDIARPYLTYGFDKQADVRAIAFRQEGLKTFFEVEVPSREIQNFKVELNLPGKHNVLNALAAITIALECHVSIEAIQHALKEFAGVGRRFQLYGDIATSLGKVTLLDDYGHHPREISATLEAVRASWPDRRVVLIFQPHRYTRTQALFKEFVEVLKGADALVLLPVYAAGEATLKGATSQDLHNALKGYDEVDCVYVPEEDCLSDNLKAVLQPGDVLLSQGAGSIGRLIQELAERNIC